MPPKGDPQGYTLPPPSGGLNKVDAIDNMDPSNALELENIFPTGLGAQVRNGYEEFGDTGDGDPLTSLLPITTTTGATQIVAASAAKLWAFDEDGTETNVTGGTAPTSDEYNGVVFSHSLYLANGTEAVQVYNGTTTADSTFTGVTLSNLINVSSYKERIYFVEKNTLKFWYGNTRATGASALNSFDLKYVMRLGGKLLFAGSWSNQVGTITADLFFACSSEGEIVFYNGSDPSSTSWGIVARYVIGKPLSYRSFIPVNNDVWIITDQGIVPISGLFTLDPTALLDSIGRKINPLIVQYGKTTGFNHIWSGGYWSQGRRVFIIIPTGGSTTLLAVFGLDAKGWTTYKLADTSDSISLALGSGNVYFGANSGKLFLGETGYNDNDDSIAFNARLAFSFFGTRGNFKAFKDIRPLLRTKRGIQLQLGIDTNFQRSNNVDTITTSEGTFTAWGSPWGSPWSSGIEYIFDRHSLRGQGHSGAIRIKGSLKNTPLEFYGFEVRFILGDQI